MHVFVINLPKDHERRQSITSQLGRLGLDYEILTGVYGKDLSAAEMAEFYDDKKAKRIQCRSLVRSEIGIALSHIKAYRTIMERNIQCALVLEDDVHLPDALPKVLEALEKNIDPACPEVVLLSPASLGRSGNSHLVDNFFTASFKSGYFAHSYALSLAGAGELLNFLYPVHDVADCWTRLNKYGVVKIRGLTPPLVVQNQAAFGSSTTCELQNSGIGEIRNNPMRRYAFKLRRAFFLCMDLISALRYRRLKGIAKTGI